MSKVSKLDIFVIIFLFVLSIFTYKLSSNSGTKKIKLIIDNKIIYLPFKNQLVDLKKYDKNIQIEVKNGKVRFLKSDCLGKICIREGWIKECGESAICMPNKTALQIECKGNKVDAISQ